MGAGASSIPMNIDKETFRKISGGTMNDAIFDANSVDGVMKRDRLMELSQLRDCFLSYDEGRDLSGRSIKDVVSRINQALKGKGLMTWMDEKGTGQTLVQQVGAGIDKCRSFVCFLTAGYVEKVAANNSTELASVSFNYTLRRKHPDHMVPVILDKTLLDPASWKGATSIILTNRALIDFSTFNAFDEKIDQLYQSIVRISKAAENFFAPETAMSNSVLAQTNKPKEEQQFFQWLARATNIEESRRIIYCTALVKAGISNVFGLAKMIKDNPRFLPSIGISEQDADQIGLAIGDLGLGYTPMRDFNYSSNLDTVVFALSKSAKCPDDPKIAEAALSCAARVAASHPAMPQLMSEAGICQAIMKIMTHHLAHGPSIMYASIAISNMTINDPEISLLFGKISCCDVLPRCLRSHLSDGEVAYSTCDAIGVLAHLKENRVLFCTSGACEVVVLAMQKCLKHPKVVEKACMAAADLGTDHLENVSKLGVAGICKVLPLAMAAHPEKPSVALQVFRLVHMCSVDAENRAQLGAPASCSALVRTLQLNIDSSEVIAQGCRAMVCVLIGSAINRTTIASVGACEVVRDIIQRYHSDPTVAGPACGAIFSLVAGNLESKAKLKGVLPLMQQLLADPSMPDSVKKEAREALVRLQ